MHANRDQINPMPFQTWRQINYITRNWGLSTVHLHLDDFVQVLRRSSLSSHMFENEQKKYE